VDGCFQTSSGSSPDAFSPTQTSQHPSGKAAETLGETKPDSKPVKMGKGAARPPEKLSAEEMEERRQKRREEQLGTKSDVSLRRRGITDTVPLCQIQSGSSDTESDTSDDKAVFHKRVQGGTVSYLRLRKEDDKQKEIARRGHSKKRTSKYKVP